MRWLAMLVAIGLLMAGCADDPDPADDSATDSTIESGTDDDMGAGSGSDAGSDAGDEASDGAGDDGNDAGSDDDAASEDTAGNDPPSATLSATNTAGEAPLTVDFAISASDPDGDDLTWTLDADGDGTMDSDGDDGDLPAAFSFVFETTGTFTASLTVSDGKEEDVRTVDIEVGAVVEAVEQVVDFSYVVANAGCADPPAKMVPGTPANGAVWAEWEVDPGTIGLIFEVVFEASNPVVTIAGVAFYNADGDVLEGSETIGESGMRGSVPEGAVYGIFVDCGGVASVTGTYTASPNF